MMIVDEKYQLGLLCCSLLLGGLLAFLGYYLIAGRRGRPVQPDRQTETDGKNVPASDDKKQSEQQREVTSKRQAKSKKRREAQQEFSHPWLVGALKGHTATVLDINFSANGKYLASCAEDCLAKDELNYATTAKASGDPSKSSKNSFSPPSPSSSTSSSSSSGKKAQQRAILSRRQRKNRTREQRRELRVRDEDHEDDHNAPPPPQRKQQQQQRKLRMERSNNERAVVHRSEDMAMFEAYKRRRIMQDFRVELEYSTNIAERLRRYTLSYRQLEEMGYPVPHSEHSDQAVIHYQHYPNTHQKWSSRLVHRRSTLNANAKEFVPKSARSSSEEVDSGNGSSSVESSDQELENNSDGEQQHQQQQHVYQLSPLVQRTCARCYDSFYMVRETCEYVHTEKCTYHWGRCHRNGVDEVWTCCQAPRGAHGCATGAAHVWTGILPGRNGPLEGFVRTQPYPGNEEDCYLGVYALDCETFYTRNGIEVGKVTIIALNGVVAYETLVKPAAPVIDYNTRFSGLRAENFRNVKKTLRDVQREILDFIYAETILVGHGLENDLRALKIIHLCVADTAVSYPHFKGFPYRNSLKALAKNVLGKTIQIAEHDSAEDARTALDLMERKLSTERYFEYYIEDDCNNTFDYSTENL